MNQHLRIINDELNYLMNCIAEASRSQSANKMLLVSAYSYVVQRHMERIRLLGSRYVSIDKIQTYVMKLQKNLNKHQDKVGDPYWNRAYVMALLEIWSLVRIYKALKGDN